MKRLLTDILHHIRHGGIPRLMASWLLVLTYYALRFDHKLGEVAFAESLPLITFLLTTVMFYLSLSLIALITRSTLWDRVVLGATAFVYASVITYTARDLYTGIGVCLVLGLILWYLLAHKGKERDLSPKLSIPLVAVAALLFALFTGGYTVLRYLNFSAPAFDFGIFANMFHNMKTRFLPLTTVERDGLLSHFAVHISPVYYLILPFFCLFPSPITLQIAQAVILASGVIPLYLLSRRLNFSHRSTLLWCCAYAFYPALAGGCSYDLHENCFLAPFLLWLFYFAETKKTVPMYLFALLTLSVKEDAAVYVAFFALFLLIGKKRRRHGIALLLLSMGCFLAESHLLSRYGDGVMNYRYNGYFSGDGSMVDVLLNLIRNPSLIFKHIITSQRMEFLLLMLVPLLGLPFLFGRKPSRLILIGPFLLVNLMPQYEYQYSIYFQYVFGSLAFLFYAAMLNASDKRLPAKRAFPALCAAFALMLSFSSVLTKGEILKDYRENRADYEAMEACLAEVPDDIAVKASTFLIPHLAARDEIYEMDTKHPVDCVVIDLRYPMWEGAQTTDEALQKDPAFTLIARVEGLIAVYQRTSTIPN